MSDRLEIKWIQFKTGPELNVEYTYDDLLPEGFQFWNTAVLAFMVVADTSLRDGYHGGFITSFRTGKYEINSKECLNKIANVLLCKFY